MMDKTLYDKYCFLDWKKFIEGRNPATKKPKLKVESNNCIVSDRNGKCFVIYIYKYLGPHDAIKIYWMKFTESYILCYIKVTFISIFL